MKTEREGEHACTTHKTSFLTALIAAEEKQEALPSCAG